MARSGYEKYLKEYLKALKVKFTFKSWYEPLKLPYVKKANYIPDFIIYKGSLKKPKKPLTPDDLKDSIVIEAKGFFKPSDRTKMLAVKETYPDMDIRMVFQSNGFMYKKKKGAPRRTPESTDIRYGDWCDKQGFPWAVGDIPEAWLIDTHKKDT